MPRRKLERTPLLARWQRHALLGLGKDGLTETERFDWLIDGYPDEVLVPVWRQHRERLLEEWRELRGPTPHPMDRAPPRLPEPR